MLISARSGPRPAVENAMPTCLSSTRVSEAIGQCGCATSSKQIKRYCEEQVAQLVTGMKHQAGVVLRDLSNHR
jgi:hypothetical protein